MRELMTTLAVVMKQGKKTVNRVSVVAFVMVVLMVYFYYLPYWTMIENPYRAQVTCMQSQERQAVEIAPNQYKRYCKYSLLNPPSANGIKYSCVLIFAVLSFPKHNP